ncbi:response regulator [Paenibacillus fonticola]|uniref:response regulator n=1 Tax=Paenibacillus fonticola TaxID=379896 RepID=UPI0003822764|nr:response regulator [Paenibacillus fonticola]
MLKLLIVDDEVRQVKALSAVIRKIRPQLEVIEAYEGETAWNIVQTESVDAIISDISMPILDGMELISRIYTFDPKIKIILLTGYSEFGYAHKAIQHGVVDYLVKPISYEGIVTAVEKFEQLTKQELVYEKTAQLYYDKLWNRMVKGELSGAELHELEDLVPKGCSGLLCLIDRQPSQNQGSSSASEHAARLRSAFTAELCGLGQVVSFASSGDVERNVHLLWLDRWRISTISDVNYRLIKWAEDLRSDFPDLQIGMSSLKSMNTAETCEAYQEASLALEHAFYLEREHLVRYESIMPFAAGRRLENHNQADLFADGIRSQERSTLSNLISHLLEQQSPYVRPSQLKEQAAEFMFVVSERLKRMLDEPAWSELVDRHRQQIMASNRWSELRYRLMQWSEEWITHMEVMQQDKNSIIISRCQNYLKQHYMKDVSLEEVAQKYHFNASYFSNLFKNKTGINFSDYLLETRIHHAKQLLMNTDEKITHISQSVGFRNTAYFIKMFKRKTGLSPNTFRQMAGKEKTS